MDKVSIFGKLFVPNHNIHNKAYVYHFYKGFATAKNLFRIIIMAVQLICYAVLSNKTGPGSSVSVGTEYKDGNLFSNGAQNEDVPCALCKGANTSSSIMVTR